MAEGHGDNRAEWASMTSPWPTDGPRVRDELDALSTAVLAQLGDAIPGVSEEPPPGWTELVDGRGVYLRRTARRSDTAGDSPDAWYVHGLAGSSANWTSLAGALATRSTGYLVDLPGHGRSDPPPGGRYSLTDDADLLAVLISRWSSGPVHLVGNSMGGVIVTALAARHPELVATLTVISPAVPDLRLTRDRGADPLLGLLLVPGTTRLALRRLGSIDSGARARGMGALCYGDPALLTDTDYEVAAAELEWREQLPWGHRSMIGALRALLKSYFRRSGSFWTDAAAVRVPTLVVWGTRDRLVDVRLAERTAAAFNRSSLLVLRGVGHTAQMEAPLPTARAVAQLWASPGAPPRGPTGPVATSTP